MYYFEGGVLFGDPLGDDAGGHGAPDELVPGFACELPELLPGLVGEVGEPEFEEPGFDPEFGFEASGVPGVPGNGPQGTPLGVVPGLFGAFGFTLEGCVLLPGVGVPGEFEPGPVPGVGVVPPVELDPGEFGFC